MNKIALAGLALGISAMAPAMAQAQSCPPGSWLCASVRIGVAPPPVVVTQQPVVYVQPPPPQRVVVVPPAPRVYVPPPPVVYYQPPQPTLVYQQQVTYTQAAQPVQRNVMFGLDGHVASSIFGGQGGAIFGGGTGFRIRGRGALGFELGVNFLSGTDFNGDHRFEVPVTASMLVFFNPQNRFQVYGLAGLGLSYGNVQYSFDNALARGGRFDAEYLHVGAHAGLGFEWQVSQRFSLYTDARLFVRQRVDDGAASNAEFIRSTPSGFQQTTNTSIGSLVNFGAILYF